MTDRRGRRGTGGDGHHVEPAMAMAAGASTGRPNVLAIILAQRERALASVTRRLGSREAARDVLQLALLKAIEGLESIRRHESIVPWFHRIVSNVAIDYQRHGAAYRRALERMAASGGETEGMSAGESRCECLDDLLPTLRPAYAAMLRRVHLEERPLEEVARRDGITATNARVRLHRARRALRRSWRHVCGGSPLERCVPCPCERRGGEKSETAGRTRNGTEARTRGVTRTAVVRLTSGEVSPGTMRRERAAE